MRQHGSEAAALLEACVWRVLHCHRQIVGLEMLASVNHQCRLHQHARVEWAKSELTILLNIFKRAEYRFSCVKDIPVALEDRKGR